MFNYNGNIESADKRAHQLAGYLDSQIRTMQECLSNIINSTESDIWGEAILKTIYDLENQVDILVRRQNEIICCYLSIYISNYHLYHSII